MSEGTFILFSPGRAFFKSFVVCSSMISFFFEISRRVTSFLRATFSEASNCSCESKVKSMMQLKNYWIFWQKTQFLTVFGRVLAAYTKEIWYVMQLAARENFERKLLWLHIFLRDVLGTTVCLMNGMEFGSYLKSLLNSSCTSNHTKKKCVPVKMTVKLLYCLK